MRVLTSFWCRAGVGRTAAHKRRRLCGRRLGMSLVLRVQLDDELLLHRGGNLAPLRLAQLLGRQRLVIGLQPRGNLAGQLSGAPDNLSGRRGRLVRDHVARPHLVAGDVHPAAVDRPMAVADELTRLAAGSREAEAHEDVVEPALEQREEVLARDAGLTGCLGVVATELLLEHAVVAAGLLLLSPPYAGLALFSAAAAALARPGAA